MLLKVEKKGPSLRRVYNKIFLSFFLISVDGIVDEQEFIYIWRSRHLGDISHAITLFHNADTDRDDVISKIPDLTRVFYYFDRDRKFLP